ncbi:uncharacterized protein PITG_15146 [Phytophthora infestans T30-4]|uniref:Uncharacterized protein n=1 Tax=Phytophthora infestans (strain T30-4) TaxID=403677 RepID=D0NRR9_PHYIT|nr:uncharacterized protein PITG_15146 [Phytophthora infestans T30-4]EEY63419.1 conserved hypothetical protein [Phytophthora infestans T30-4]|eukprot:XP_002898304.1 conserved hypothetical protein [Phytophthora infestans T30-4]
MTAVANLRDVQDLLTIRKRDLDEWARQEKAAQAEFLTLVSGGTGSSATPRPSFAALQGLFKRKIKRAKKKPAAEQEDDDDEEEDEAEDYDEDDDDDAEEEEDACPSGCDLTLYEKVLTLREKRADVDDAMGELNKAIEELRKAGERQTAEQRAINKELAATEQDTQQFQSNQLDVVVPLSTRQLCCLQAPSPTQQNWTLPAQAAGCLVFTTRAFSALSERIESLQAETKKLRQQFRDLHKQQNVLAKEKRQQQEAIARAQDRSEQLMRLKFGQLVDLEVLDRACDASLVTRGRSAESAVLNAPGGACASFATGESGMAFSHAAMQPSSPSTSPPSSP